MPADLWNVGSSHHGRSRAVSPENPTGREVSLWPKWRSDEGMLTVDNSAISLIAFLQSISGMDS